MVKSHGWDTVGAGSNPPGPVSVQTFSARVLCLGAVSD